MIGDEVDLEPPATADDASTAAAAASASSKPNVSSENNISPSRDNGVKDEASTTEAEIRMANELEAKLEESIPTRRTEPENEADAFLAFLIEDFADEWLLWPFFRCHFSLCF